MGSILRNESWLGTLVTLREASLIEFQIGPIPWWNTRLHLVAPLAHDLGGAREFVFVDIHRRFLTMATPAEIRERLAQRWPPWKKHTPRSGTRRLQSMPSNKVFGDIQCRPSIPSKKNEQIAKEDVTALDLERTLGIARDAETVDVVDKGQLFLQREILGRPSPFTALSRKNRLDGTGRTRGASPQGCR